MWAWSSGRIHGDRRRRPPSLQGTAAEASTRHAAEVTLDQEIYSPLLTAAFGVC
jgi:hypothetical protein